MATDSKKEKPLRAATEYTGYLKKKVLDLAKDLGLKPGQVVKMIVHQHFKDAA